MRELAPGWTLSRVGDLFDMQIGKKLNKEATAGPEQREYITNKDVQWNRIRFNKLNRMSFSAAERERFRLLPGDLLVTEGGEVGRTAIWEGQREECYFQMSLHRLRTRGAIEPRYMLHYMAYAARFDLFVNGVSQTSIAHLPQDKFAEQLVAHPVDLAEQRRIVEVIDGVTKVEHAIEKSITKLRSVRQGVVSSFFSSLAGGVEARCVNPLESVADVGGGLALGGISAEGGTIELPYLRVANVQDGFISTEELKTVRVTPAEAKRFQLARGDVLVTEGGDFDKVGRGAVWDARFAPCLHQNHVFRVRCRKGVMIPEFLSAYMASQAGRAYFLGVAKQTTNLASISSSQLKAMPVPCPPLSEQERVVKGIAVCDKQISREASELGKLRQLKLGIADNLFSGRVAVPAAAA
ncbi:restriction endonuclease subunit S [Streptomyces collinus]